MNFGRTCSANLLANGENLYSRPLLLSLVQALVADGNGLEWTFAIQSAGKQCIQALLLHHLSFSKTYKPLGMTYYCCSTILGDPSFIHLTRSNLRRREQEYSIWGMDPDGNDASQDVDPSDGTNRQAEVPCGHSLFPAFEDQIKDATTLLCISILWPSLRSTRS